MKKVFIAGTGLTRVGRQFGKGLRELFAEAALKAIEASNNVNPQAVVVGNMLASALQEQDNLGSLLADYVGLRGRPAFKVEAACGSGGAAVYAGYSLVASGLADVVLVVGVEKMTDHATDRVTRALAQAADAEYELFYGASFAGLNALVMRYYMDKHGVSREDMAEWPVLMHENAKENPYAQLRFKVTVEQVINSPLIADPIRLLDSSPIGDGAAALILASEDVVRKLTDTPVEVAGVGMVTDSVDVASRDELDFFPSVKEATDTALRMAKVGLNMIDLVELHDAFSIMGFLSLESMGFAGRGESVRMLKEGAFREGDRPVVNPSGGLKARGHPVGATGVYQVVEVAMQLRGEFPGVKVSGAELGIAQNVGGLASSATVFVLRR